MPKLSITFEDSCINYYLICYDKLGNERTDDPHDAFGLLSRQVVEIAHNGKYTDIFFISHGWKGDIPEAIDQYKRWIAAMVACKADLARLRDRPQGFNPLIVGLHWPSLPFGIETHSQTYDHVDPALQSFSSNIPLEGWRSQAVESIADSDIGKQALQTFLEDFELHDSPDELDESSLKALGTLLKEEIQSDQVPAEERVDLDPAALFKEFKTTIANNASDDPYQSYGSLVQNGGIIAGILTQLSAWKMKERARRFGENGASQLLRELQSITSAETQCHLMGHSFGTIVVSSAVTGTGGSEALPRPVNSMILVQGAVSLWAFSKTIPVQKGLSGYYKALSDPEYIKGPLVVTHTANDTAVKTIYPLMAWTSMYETVSFDPTLPRHGAIGRFGVQGEGIQIESLEMLPVEGEYCYAPNTFFNLHSSEYIKDNETLFGGAHNDIDHPEVAHAFLAAIQ